MIVNADDFGAEHGVNRAILQAFQEGLVSSTTLMANMPGFEEACELVHAHGLHSHVGVHLVLTEGLPLTEPIRTCARFCDESGRFFHWSLTSRALWLDGRERAAVAEELRAQVLRCRRAGVPVTHLDSHHQTHTHPGIGGLVIALAREARVPSVRIAENCRAGMTWKQWARTRSVNLRLRVAGLARTRYFGTIEDYVAAMTGPVAPERLSDFEVMTHPVFDRDGALTTRRPTGPRSPSSCRGWPDTGGPSRSPERGTSRESRPCSFPIPSERSGALALTACSHAAAPGEPR